jgi:hypothetical protein
MNTEENDKIRRRIGIMVLIALFIVFIIILVYTIKPFSNNVKPFGESPIIKQRIINIEKSK